MPSTLRALSRSLRQSPFSAGIAVLTLALTTWAAASIFSLVDAILLTPPPFSDPGAVVVLRQTSAFAGTVSSVPVTYARLEEWRGQASALADIEGYDGTNATLTGLGNAERVSITDVTPGFLHMLGINPWLGRAFDARDTGERLVIVSYAFWKNRLAHDSRAIGRTLTLNGEPHRLVGVLPDRFTFALDQSDVWRPMPRLESPAAQARYTMGAVARLASGVTPAQLVAALERVDGSHQPGVRTTSTPVATAISGEASRPISLLAAVATIALLVAFINFAGLLMVRALDRHRDLTIRGALGASRFHLHVQALLESHVLAAIGTAAGILLAAWSTTMVQTFAAQQFGRAAPSTFALSWRVIGAVTFVAWGSALACGAWPAFTFARVSHADALRHGYTGGARELRWRRAIVSSQVALAFVLLIALGTVGRSLMRSLSVDPGFVADGVMTMQVNVPAAKYQEDSRVAWFYGELENRLAGRVGDDVAIVDELPLTGNRGRSGIGRLEREPRSDAVLRTVSPKYFAVMGIPVLGGRPFDSSDTIDAAPRVVLSRSLAATLFPSESAVGREVWIAATERMAEVIGIVGDVTHRSLDDAASPTLYFSSRQVPSRSSIIVVRSARAPTDVAGIVRRTVATLDSDMPVYRARPMREVVDASPGVPARRMMTAVFLTFSMLALVLGAFGLFGLFAHDVARRRIELAVRAALGAAPGQMSREVLTRAFGVIGTGLAAGTVLSWPTGEALHAAAMTSSHVDAVVIIAAAVILIVSGAIAALPSARRASRTNPLYSLRPV